MVGGYQGQPDNVDQENWNKISHFISTDISRAAAAVQRHNELEPYIYQLEILNFDIDTVMKTQHVQKAMNMMKLSLRSCLHLKLGHLFAKICFYLMLG